MGWPPHDIPIFVAIRLKLRKFCITYIVNHYSKPGYSKFNYSHRVSEMSKVARSTTRKRKVAINLILIGLGVICVNLSSTPYLAGGTGDFSLSSKTSRWGLTAVRAKEVWEDTEGLAEVTVTVFDSGVDRLTLPLPRYFYRWFDSFQLQRKNWCRWGCAEGFDNRPAFS